MSKFVTKKIKTVNGKQVFMQLIVLSDEADIKKLDEKNLKGQLDIYEDSLESKYTPSFNRLLSIMNAVANLQGLPDTQWRDVTPKKEKVKEYEVKAGDLRVFAIKVPNGKLVILGGYKNQQLQNFREFRSLKKQFLESN